MAMLALGVVIVSSVRAFPVDLTDILFGDILALQWSDMAALAVIAPGGGRHLRPRPPPAHRPGLRPPDRPHPGTTTPADCAVLLGGIAVSIVASDQSVDTLLVVGLLVAPPAAASHGRAASAR